MSSGEDTILLTEAGRPSSGLLCALHQNLFSPSFIHVYYLTLNNVFRNSNIIHISFLWSFFYYIVIFVMGFLFCFIDLCVYLSLLILPNFNYSSCEYLRPDRLLNPVLFLFFKKFIYTDFLLTHKIYIIFLISTIILTRISETSH